MGDGIGQLGLGASEPCGISFARELQCLDRVVASTKGTVEMETANIQAYARQLYEAQGPKAIAEAAQKAASYERQGKSEEAQTWRRIEAALMLLRGPRES